MTQNYEDYHGFLREQVIEPFYTKRLTGLQSMHLKDVLLTKNPYLFKAKNIDTPGDLAKSIVDAFLSSQEETVFGNLLESFAVHVAETLYGGFKSERKSVDLEFERDGIYYIVGIKSGTNWGNSDQLKAMRDNFKNAREDLTAEGITDEIVAVNGCIYGKDNTPKKIYTPKKTGIPDLESTYYKYAGQEFWKFISGDDELYREIIVPIDEEAKLKDETFRKAYTAKVNELTLEFSINFLDATNLIDWSKLVTYVSGRESIKLKVVPAAERSSDTQIESALRSDSD